MTLRVISYGGGVQSTALVVLAAQRKLDPIMGGEVRTALFANTGDDSEHPATLKYVREIAIPWAKQHGIDIHELQTTKNGEPTTIWNEIMKPDSKRMLIPVYGDINMPLQRSCTVDFKIKTVGRWVKKNGAKKTTQPSSPSASAPTKSNEQVEAKKNTHNNASTHSSNSEWIASPACNSSTKQA